MKLLLCKNGNLISPGNSYVHINRFLGYQEIGIDAASQKIKRHIRASDRKRRL